MVSVPLSEVGPAVATLRTILAAVGYRGIFGGEFKRDERDGLFKILEVNARVWIYVEFAGRCGVDVCTMAYRDALGLEVTEAAHYRTGVRLVSPYLDFAAVRYAWRLGQMSQVRGCVLGRRTARVQPQRPAAGDRRLVRYVTQGAATCTARRT